MVKQEFEQLLGRIMKADLASGTEAFRDALLVRCLNTLAADVECTRIDDAELEFLAAAGDPNANIQNALEPGGFAGDNGSGN